MRNWFNSGPHPRPLEVSWRLFLTWQMPESHSKALSWVTLNTALPFSGQFPYAATCDDSFLRVWIAVCIFWLDKQHHNPFLCIFSNFPIRHKAGDPFLSPAASLLPRLPAPVYTHTHPPPQTVLKISFATEAFRMEADLWAWHQDLDLQSLGEVTPTLFMGAYFCVCCSAVQGSRAGKTQTGQHTHQLQKKLAQGGSLYPLSRIVSFSDLRLSPIWDTQSSFSTWTPDHDHRLHMEGKPTRELRYRPGASILLKPFCHIFPARVSVPARFSCSGVLACFRPVFHFL